MSQIRLTSWLSLSGLLLAVSALCSAETLTVQLTIKDHLFFPSELVVPANTKIRLEITNEDPTPEEFESYELNREKVVMGNSHTVVFIGPLQPGEYPFFGEFNLSTAQGKVIAR